MVAHSCLNAQEGMTQSEIEVIKWDDSIFTTSKGSLPINRIVPMDTSWIRFRTVGEEKNGRGQWEKYYEPDEQTEVESAIRWIDSTQPHRPFTWIVDSADYSPPDPAIHLSDLIEYQTECYNDSTLVQAYIPYDCGQPFCLVDHPKSTYVEYWIHAEPTFEGFIKWIKSRR